MKLICLVVLMSSATVIAAPIKFGCILSYKTDHNTGGGPGRPSFTYDSAKAAKKLKALRAAHKPMVVKQEVTEDFPWATVNIKAAEGAVCDISPSLDCKDHLDLAPTHKIVVTLTDKKSGQVVGISLGEDVSHPVPSLDLEMHLPVVSYTPTYEIRNDDGDVIRKFDLTCQEVYY
jgi:hypothetical protein